MGTNDDNKNKIDRRQQRNEDDSICSEQTQTVPQQFMEHDCCRLLLHSLSFLDVVTLWRKQIVSKQFKELCTQTITAKCGKDGPPPLTNETLRTAVREFCPIMYDPNRNKEDMETIACTYGYPIDSWNVSQSTDMTFLFCGPFGTDEAIQQKSTGAWLPSDISEMNWLPYFNEYIGSWDTSNVKYMVSMFDKAIHFNQDIGSWDVSNVKYMDSMFHGARQFNQDIGRWDVSNVKYMPYMFCGARQFNQDIGRWNVSNVESTNCMFMQARTFNQDIGRWNISNLRDMTEMFGFAYAFNHSLRSWDVSHVLDKHGMLPEGFPEKFRPRNL
ncbi:fibronectin domain containing protein [Nitzschia inconspicua]|uniref:Fibronectin domain containing protein n=1 Tax=Nitzschia inconspicua TaxID=303405 RepID=A0A9K3PS09_9STRA|nr:fibronectin domain containing protein [Nitzschia inconspicua]